MWMASDFAWAARNLLLTYTYGIRVIFLAFSLAGFAPDEHRSSTQRHNGSDNDPHPENDVKNHLFTRQHTSLHAVHLIDKQPIEVLAVIHHSGVIATSVGIQVSAMTCNPKQ
jgi:hypothetical protein